MTADQIRSLLSLIHPTIAATAKLIPGGAAAEEFIYSLITTPGVLEDVLKLLHVQNALPASIKAPE